MKNRGFVFFVAMMLLLLAYGISVLREGIEMEKRQPLVKTPSVLVEASVEEELAHAAS